MIGELLLDECRQLALAIAPELADRPLYVMLRAELEPELCRAGRGCLGWVSRGSWSMTYADSLGDRWEGFGNVIVLDGFAIEDASGPGQIVRVVKNVLVHEVAHLVPPLKPIPIPADLRPSERVKQMCRERFVNNFASVDPAPGSDRDLHGMKFVRFATHLYYRAATAGHDICVDDLFGAWHNKWALPTYMITLLEECARMRSATFEEIAATTPPAHFMTQWTGDVEDCKHKLKNEVLQCR